MGNLAVYNGASLSKSESQVTASFLMFKGHCYNWQVIFAINIGIYTISPKPFT